MIKMKLFNIRNVLATGFIAGSLISTTPAFADEINTVKADEQQTTTATVDAGVTPDSFLYNFDKLFESLRLTFTTNSNTEAELLLQNAQERLAEANEMSELEQLELVKETIGEYIETIKEAQEQVSETTASDDVNSETKEELANQLEETAEIDVEFEEQLDEQTQEELEGAQEEAKVVASVVLGLDKEVVTSLREQDFGYGQIAKIVALSEISGKSVEDISTLVKDGQGFGEISNELGIKPQQIKSTLVEMKSEGIQQALESAKTEGDTKQVKKLEKRLASLEKQKKKSNKKSTDSAPAVEEVTNEMEEATATPISEEPTQPAPAESTVATEDSLVVKEVEKTGKTEKQNHVNKPVQSAKPATPAIPAQHKQNVEKKNQPVAQPKQNVEKKNQSTVQQEKHENKGKNE
jgi:hypothetical protein